MEQFNKETQIQIELSEEVAQGIYSNLAVISHSISEFVIDFIRIVPGMQKAKVKSRIILTPEHAKRLLHALKENIDNFEQQNGPIRIQNDPGFLPPLGGMGEA
jgi:predicted transcriptional regulator